jgi:putative MFS transporter
MIALSPLLPESARFLQHMGRMEEARAVLAQFGTVAVSSEEREEDDDLVHLPPVAPEYVGTTIALTVAALTWSLVNFGLLLWLPSALVAEGNSVGLTSAIIARSTLVAAPTIIIATYLYSTWSTKGSLMAMIAITAVGLAAFLLRDTGTIPLLDSPVVPLVLIIVGSTGVISMLLPYAAENYPVKIRGRATGWIAGWSKLGGLLAQGLSTLALVPAIGTAAGGIAGLCVLSLGLIAVFGHETRGRDLRQLEGATERA